MKPGFTVSLAAADALPVLAFLACGIALSAKVQSTILVLGVILAVCAGACKVLWKFIIAIKAKDVEILPKLFRICMPCGFALMIASLAFSWEQWQAIVSRLFLMPSLALVVIGMVCMILMAVFALKLDRESARNNWIEEGTNTVAQIAFLVAILLI